ncbi:predicted protein [Chaetomium globosum CBS 148.51]|uniref:Granulins domain-containing protein n=1 Tax=Chaetomium globosum (strain ATCC 6205 / CBS 148.51 / DSM 1962 / NBRC 6347 / NRRL 1970) TaxID=306901 RepID=Q2GNC4_CHAGB|nr:uncharacterized protein CHGG_10530 [Chaetomium globosum CBS 148.51]EAQ84126.1 predicted protein [Chaetomium globosum CBS 148.51]
MHSPILLLTLLTTLTLATPTATQHGASLPEQALTDNAVAAGANESDIPQPGSGGGGFSTNALYCPIDFPRYCPYGFCCRTSKCCGLECCTEAATFCSAGRCYR